MRILVTGLAFAAMGSLGIASCSKPNSPEDAKVASTAPASPVHESVLGPGVETIPPDCPSDIKAPEVTYITTIKNNFELRKAVVDQSTENLTELKLEGTPKVPATTQANKKTRMDTVVTLAPGHSGIIRILLKNDDKLHLRTDSYVVRGGDDKAKYMFCKVTSVSDTEVYFTVYSKADGTGPKTSSFNLGLVVSDKDLPDRFNLPIFIDPSVENDGIQ